MESQSVEDIKADELKEKLDKLISLGRVISKVIPHLKHGTTEYFTVIYHRKYKASRAIRVE